MRTCACSMQMKPSVEVSREAAVVPAVNVCTRRKHPLQPHATVASLGRSAPLLFITPSCTLALSVSLFCSLSLLLLFSFHVFFFFFALYFWFLCTCTISIVCLFHQKMVLVGCSHELMVLMLGQRSGKLQPKLTHASTDLS